MSGSTYGVGNLSELKAGLWGWRGGPVGESACWCQHEDLSLNPWQPRKKPGMAKCACNFSSAPLARLSGAHMYACLHTPSGHSVCPDEKKKAQLVHQYGLVEHWQWQLLSVAVISPLFDSLWHDNTSLRNSVRFWMQKEAVLIHDPLQGMKTGLSQGQKYNGTMQ